VPYSLRDYGQMMADDARVKAYAAALEKVLRPGDVVLDLGAGTGIFSLLACKLGARRVYACDPSPVVQLARDLGRANGFADRIVCHEGPSQSLTLSEPADVIVSDLRGLLPFLGRNMAALVDARRRLLKPGGAVLPQSDLLWVALASAPEEYQRATTPWLANDFGFDLGPWSAMLANSLLPARPRATQLVSPPVLWTQVDYRVVRDLDARGRVTCVADRDSDAHGFFLWFDATITEGVGFSGGPDGPSLPYGCAFFPWPRAVSLERGEAVAIDLAATAIGDDYTWTWRTVVGDARFEQSTFFATLVPAGTTQKRSESHVPELSQDGQITLRALEGLRQRRPVGEIADELFAEFGGRFASRGECLAFVGDLSVKYGA
jgi:protein arginine N-methyltransferase 1